MFFYKNSAKIILMAVMIISSIACQKNAVKKEEMPIAPLAEVPAQLLNYRFESDVPAPSEEKKTQTDERNPAIQTDFDQTRPQEILDKTITSPNKQRVLAIYHKIGDLTSEFRLDMYSADGKLLNKITHEEMAVHFADTVVWSPDSNNVAFVAMVRGGRIDTVTGEEDGKNSNANTTAELVDTDANRNSNTNTNADANTNANTNAETNANTSPESANTIITFRTEQIYICNADGIEVTPLTQNEGLIYFYFVWSPDSEALAALATPITEWRIMQQRMTTAGYLFIPQGRPRLIEKTGRERLLDDFPTNVRPVWSPDSSKVAVAFNKQIRIYDAAGERTTQAAIPLRNDLLISSRAYDSKLTAEEKNIANTANSNGNTGGEKKPPTPNANANPANNQPQSALPDPNTLVSFNPIITLEWTQPDLLYLQTGFVREMQEQTESVKSYLRWHRLILSSQVANINQTNPK
jgi:hypothetical protein